MKWSATTRTWGRRTAIVAESGAFAAAAVAVAAALGASWLKVLGLVSAAFVAGARLYITERRSALEGRQEQHALRQRVDAFDEVEKVRPAQLGIDGAAQDILPDGDVPRYVPRLVDGQLRDAVAAAFDPDASKWLVIVIGESKVGKSRTLYEACRHCSAARDGGRLVLIAPASAKALGQLLQPGGEPRMQHGRAILWLGDIERLIDDGLTFRLLDDWHAAHGGAIVATYGGRLSARTQDTGGLQSVFGSLLGAAEQVVMEQTTRAELGDLAATLSPSDLAAIERYGLAAFLVAAQLLATKLRTGVHVGYPRCPEGVALIDAAVSWALCGRTDAIATGELRELWQAQLDADSPAPPIATDDEHFQAALDWAQRPVAGDVALLAPAPAPERPGSYRVYDYAVRLSYQRPELRPPLAQAWQVAMREVDAPRALSVGAAAFWWRRLDDAIVMFRLASASEDPVIGAAAGVNLGLGLRAEGRLAEQLVAFDEVVGRFGDVSEGDAQLYVAAALYNKAVALRTLGKLAESRELGAEVQRRFGESPEPRVGFVVAESLVNTASIENAVGEFAQAQQTAGLALARLAGGAGPEADQCTADAMRVQGEALAGMGETEQMLGACEAIISRFEHSPLPSIRVHVRAALLTQAGVAASRGDLQAGRQALERLLALEPVPPLPIADPFSASALLDRGFAQAQLGRIDEALAGYQAVIDGCAAAADPDLRETGVRALMARASTLADAGRTEDARSAYEDVVARYSQTPGMIEGQAVSDARAWLDGDPVEAQRG